MELSLSAHLDHLLICNVYGKDYKILSVSSWKHTETFFFFFFKASLMAFLEVYDCVLANSMWMELMYTTARVDHIILLFSGDLEYHVF